MKRCYLFVITFALLFAQDALAQTFAVKGVLRDPLGRTVVDGAYKLTLRLYTQETGGSEFWSEIHGSVQAQHGVVSVELGSVESLAGVGFNETYWLGIQVENHAEMAPRIELGTNPYSLAVKGKDHVFPSTGNVGVNTLSPTQNLEVNGNAKVTGALIFGDGSSMSSADLGGTASSLLNPSTVLITADSDQDGGGEIQFLTGTSTDMVIRNDGNIFIPNRLGIGTSTPGENLSIEGVGSTIELGAGVAGKQADAGKISYARHSSGLDIVGVGSDQASRRVTLWAEGGTDLRGGMRVGGGGYQVNGQVLSVAPGITHFDRSGIEGGAMTIDGNNGRVGIGTNAPTSALSVVGDAAITGNMAIGTTAAPRALALAGVGSSIELGAGVPDKDVHSGKIAFRLFSDALDIVGAGSNSTRRILFHAQQGASIAGNLRIGGGEFAPSGQILSVAPGFTYFDKPFVVGGAMTIDGNNGRVGIGTATPSTSLEVVGGIGLGIGDFHFLNKDGVAHHPGTNNNPISIRSQFGIVANEFWAVSDRRIKDVLGTSDAAQDLETLKDLDIVDYSYIDVVAKGGRAHKKLIAQQVRDVYPRAVNEAADFIPSVYQMSAATKFENGLLVITTEKEHGFAAADTVRLVIDAGYEERVVQQVVDAHTFAIECAEAADQVFVYGKKVHDFLSVDYEAVAMLNVSATQELAQRVENLERENAALQAELRRYQALKVRMERFEAVLQRLEGQRAGENRAEDVVVEAAGLSLAD